MPPVCPGIENQNIDAHFIVLAMWENQYQVGPTNRGRSPLNGLTENLSVKAGCSEDPPKTYPNSKYFWIPPKGLKW